MSSPSRWIIGVASESDFKNGSDSEASSEPLLQNNELPTKTPLLRMVFFGSIVAAPYILAGMNISFSAIALPQMNLNIDEASWFGSLGSFGSLLGAISVGLIIDKYGRRPSFILSIIPSIIGWTILAVDCNTALSFFGIFLAGIMPGCVYIGQIYAAESIVVNHHHLRNSFATWSIIATAVGVLLNYLLSRLLPFQMVAWVAAALAVLSLLFICIFIPESPVWLFRQGQIRRAKNSEKRLSIRQPVLEDVYHDIAGSGGDGGCEFDLQPIWQNFKQGCHKLKRKNVYKPLLIMTTWLTLTVSSGGSCVNAYLVNILSDYPSTKSSLQTTINNPGREDKMSNGYDMVIISGILVLVASILTSFLVTHLGIKKLYYISSICMAVSLATLAVSLSLDEKYQKMRFWGLAHTAAVWMTPFFYCLGVVTIPVSVIGEMFPHDAKGYASLPSISFCGLGGVLIKLHLYFYNYLNYWIYYIYAMANVFGVIFVAIFVPETVGKTLEEIEEHFLK